MEEWKDVVGYEDTYQVSNYGNVRSKDRIITFTRKGKEESRMLRSKPVKSKKDKDGYVIVSLHNSETHTDTTARVHRIELEAFVGNELNLPFVNHKDEDKSNNMLSNLEYCTAKYNTNYGTCIRRRSNNKKIPIIQLDKNGNFIREWKSATDAANTLNLDNSSISACVRGTLPHYYGYLWRKKI